MRLKVCLAGALLCAFSAFAQHEHGQQPPAMDAAAEAMMKAGTPGEAHKRLDAFAGTWDTKISFWVAPGVPPMTSAGTSTNTWMFGGRYLEQRFKGDMGGMPFEGLGYTGYDNIKQQYWGTWIDNMSTALNATTGATADGKVWTFSGMMPDPMTGKDTKIDEKITVIDADHHTMEMWGPGPDGTPFKNLEITYTRKK